MKKISSVNIIHSSTRDYKETLSRCEKVIEGNGVIIKNIVANQSQSALRKLDSSADLILVIGGDGTMIGAIRDLSHLETPFLGVNIGKLGFLTDLQLGSLELELPKIFKGNYQEESRNLLEVSNNKDSFTLVNEVVLHSGELAKMTSFSIYKNQKLIANHKSDGLIISSATGSTAYMYSGGGPVLYPTLDVFAIMPMFSHSSSTRPLVIPAEDELELKYEHNEKAKVILDGHNEFDLNSGENLKIKNSTTRYLLLHPQDYDYFEACRSKLYWGLPIVK
jgi:NAD+ kinase